MNPYTTYIFKTCILSVMSYGAENWTITKNKTNMLRVTQCSMKRSMLGISLRDKKHNEWIGIPADKYSFCSHFFLKIAREANSW